MGIFVVTLLQLLKGSKTIWKETALKSLTEGDFKNEYKNRYSKVERILSEANIAKKEKSILEN